MQRLMRSAVMSVAMIAAAGTVAAQAPSTAPQFSVGGVAYAQWNYNLSGELHNNAFDVTRTYLNFNGKFTGGISTRITPDIYRNADGSLGYRLKYGYVAYAPGAGTTTWKFGMIQTPWLGREEDLWGYRMQGTVALDRSKYISSSDFGVSVDTRLGGRLDLSAGIYNGETYSKPEGDQRKDFAVRASYLLSATDETSAVGGLRLTGMALLGTPTGGGTRDRFVGMVSYATKQMTLAAEYASVTDSSTTAPTPEVTGSVISAFGVYRFTGSKWAVIGRVDQVDPNTDASDDASTRIIAGASYQLTPNVRLLGDVDLLSHEAGDPDATIDPRNQALFQLQFTF